MTKRDKWSESDIDALPPGEHDYFERKSGRLFADTGALLGALAKAISALANSSGGHIILGVADDGTPDGVPPTHGNIGIRDWLEQKIPRLVEYPIADFRVHIVERSSPSRIPAGREVVVIDVGDSALAPHQCAHGGGDARKYVYYYRQAGRSEPAPHFYLELLRQRLVSPTLEVESCRIIPLGARRVEGGIFLGMQLRFTLKNTGRVAAYKWSIGLKGVEGLAEARSADYKFRRQDFPAQIPWPGGIRIDDTVLPDCSMKEDIDWGVIVRPRSGTRNAIRDELELILVPLVFRYRVATETSPGKLESVVLREVLNIEELLDFVVAQLGAQGT